MNANSSDRSSQLATQPAESKACASVGVEPDAAQIYDLVTHHYDSTFGYQSNIEGAYQIAAEEHRQSGIAKVTAALASPAQAPTDPIRVACVTLDGSTLTVPVVQLGDVLHGEDDQHTYTLTFKTMTRAEFDALGEFNGF